MKHPLPPITKICTHCGINYTRPNWKVWRESLYCSSACYDAARRALPPDERAALMTNATATIRGAKRSHQDLCNRAKGKQRTAKLSGDEAVIFAALIESGLQPVPLMAIDKFNVDFGFPDAMLAVEYHGGNWHNTRKKRLQDDRKRAVLESLGWRVLEFPRLDKPQANDAGNARIQIAALIQAIHQALTSTTGPTASTQLG